MTPNDSEILIERGAGRKHYWREAWHHRHLLSILALRDISVRYKQTAIGILWIVVRPLATMVVLTLVFGRLARMPTEGDSPYSLMVLAALVPWFLISSIVAEGSSSLLRNSGLITKVYFPRIILPQASVLSSLVEFGVNLGVLALVMTWYGYAPSMRVLLLPLFIVLAIVTGLAPALLMGALNVRYRDVGHIVPFLLQFGIYASPIGYSSSIVAEHWRLVYSLNPIVGVVDGFRWCVVGSSLFIPGLVVSTVVAVIFFAGALTYFRKADASFADTI